MSKCMYCGAHRDGPHFANCPTQRGGTSRLLVRGLVALALFAVASLADAATMYVTEFAGAPPVPVLYQAPKAPALVFQTVAVSGSSAQSAAFSSTTGLVRVTCDVVCDVVVGGTNPTATTSSSRMAAGTVEYYVVAAGDKIAVIAGT